MTDHEFIRRTIALYAQLPDDQRWQDLGQLSHVDVVLPWAGTVLRGRQAIVAGLPAHEPPEPGRIKYFAYAPVIDIEGSEASAWSEVIVSRVPASGAAEMSWVGRYHDRLRREQGHWRFWSHVAVRTGDPIPAGELPTPAG